MKQTIFDLIRLLCARALECKGTSYYTFPTLKSARCMWDRIVMAHDNSGPLNHSEMKISHLNHSEMQICFINGSIIQFINSIDGVQCIWTADHDPEIDDYDMGMVEITWFSECGAEFMFNEGTPKENEMIYCFKCGKLLKEKENDDTN